MTSDFSIQYSVLSNHYQWITVEICLSSLSSLPLLVLQSKAGTSGDQDTIEVRSMGSWVQLLIFKS